MKNKISLSLMILVILISLRGYAQIDFDLYPKDQICSKLIFGDFNCSDCSVSDQELPKDIRTHVWNILSNFNHCSIISRDRFSVVLRLRNNEKAIANIDDLSEDQKKDLMVEAERILFGQIKMQDNQSCLVTIEVVEFNTTNTMGSKIRQVEIPKGEFRNYSDRNPYLERLIVNLLTGKNGSEGVKIPSEETPSKEDLPNTEWRKIPGSGKNIDIGADGSVWMVGTNPIFGGFGIYYWNGSDWTSTDGGALKIAVAPDGTPWVVSDFAGTIYRRKNGAWELLPGLAKDIDIGADGSIWVIGIDPALGGFSVYKWNGSDWTKVNGGGVKIAVDPKGKPWIINDTGLIFRHNGNDWELLPGMAREIDIDPNGIVYIIGTDARAKGYGVWKWNGSNWEEIAEGIVNLSAGPKGEIWGINAMDEIMKYSPK